MNDMIQTGFDYAALPVLFTKTDIEYLEQCVTDIEIGGRITIEGIMRVGKRMNDARAKFGDNDKAFGQWRKGRLPWLEYQTALNFMRVYSKFGDENLLYNNYRVENLAPTVLYALAAPSTPESVVEKAIEKAETGAKVTVADVKDWKAELDAATQRCEEFRHESNERRKTIRTLEEQIDLLTTRDRMLQGRLEKADEEIKYLATVIPEPEKVIVAPDDYETAKTKAAQLETELANLKKEQAKLISSQVKAKLHERQAELDKLEQDKQLLDEVVSRKKAYLASIDSDIKRIETHQKVIEENRLHLISLAAFLSDEEPVQDADTRKRWNALADMLAEAMNAVRHYAGDPKPALSVIRSDAA